VAFDAQLIGKEHIRGNCPGGRNVWGKFSRGCLGNFWENILRWATVSGFSFRYRTFI